MFVLITIHPTAFSHSGSHSEREEQISEDPKPVSHTNFSKSLNAHVLLHPWFIVLVILKNETSFRKAGKYNLIKRHNLHYREWKLRTEILKLTLIMPLLLRADMSLIKHTPRVQCNYFVPTQHARGQFSPHTDGCRYRLSSCWNICAQQVLWRITFVYVNKPVISNNDNHSTNTIKFIWRAARQHYDQRRKSAS